ncbi:HNH homing endonuclease [Acinetobacter phage vB_AbaP_APK32]|uniref:HNH homing endonuclease n=1 Tax=Acinetobacter phage vB_AbaP_APK32 TaxID=2500563 RepID=A0A5H2UHN3_9CAUD|nr:HNH homing endonuclease [Acinetobacter phage vB_AbaP_APK32]
MDNIKNLIENTTLTLEQIAQQLGVGYKRVYNVWRKYPKEYRTNRKTLNYRTSKLGANNPMTGKFKEAHPNYKGVVGDSKGYLMVLKPDWFTGRKGSKHVFLHNVVVCEALGLTELPAKWCVHHCDENTHNNNFDNLVLMTMQDHARLHNSLAGATTISKESTLKWVEAHGTPFKV